MASVYGTNGNDTLYGFSTSDSMYGYAGNDWMSGGAGDDFLSGGAGNDRLYGGTGYNDFWGGSGYDWFSMSGRGTGFSDDFILDFTFNFDKIDVSGWGISDFSQIQALLGSDGAGNARINAYYFGYNHVLTIEDVAPYSLISSDFVYSASGPKNEAGTNYADVLFGSRHNDALYGYGGVDRLLGGIGNDTLSGGALGDVINGGVGSDTASYVTSAGGLTADLLSTAANTGEAYGDIYQSIENLAGSNYADSLRGNNLANTISGLQGNDLLYGRGGADRLFGGIGNDFLSGNEGNDTLSGEAGIDLVDGGLGWDALYGGADNDRFIFRSAADSAVGGTRDVIYDLDKSGNDYIDLSLMPGVTTFIGAAAFNAPGQVRAIQFGAHVLVQINTAGASGADSEILVSNSSLGTGAGQVWTDDFLL